MPRTPVILPPEARRKLDRVFMRLQRDAEERARGQSIAAVERFGAVLAPTSRKYAANIGDGSETTFALTHGLGTRDVVVGIHQQVSPYVQITDGVEIQLTSVTEITLIFTVAPAPDQYRVVVLG